MLWQQSNDAARAQNNIIIMKTAEEWWSQKQKRSQIIPRGFLCVWLHKKTIEANQMKPPQKQTKTGEEAEECGTIVAFWGFKEEV